MKNKPRQIESPDLSLILCCPSCKLPAAFAVVMPEDGPLDRDDCSAYPVCLQCGRAGMQDFNQSPFVDARLMKPN